MVPTCSTQQKAVLYPHLTQLATVLLILFCSVFSHITHEEEYIDSV